MKINFPKLEPALYLISTPIGTLSDLTFRAINVLQNVNVLLAEDTRVLRKLMNLMDIDLNGRNISSYNDNSGDEVRVDNRCSVHASSSSAQRITHNVCTL